MFNQTIEFLWNSRKLPMTEIKYIISDSIRAPMTDVDLSNKYSVITVLLHTLPRPSFSEVWNARYGHKMPLPPLPMVQSTQPTATQPPIQRPKPVFKNTTNQAVPVLDLQPRTPLGNVSSVYLNSERRKTPTPPTAAQRTGNSSRKRLDFENIPVNNSLQPVQDSLSASPPLPTGLPQWPLQPLTNQLLDWSPNQVPADISEFFDTTGSFFP